MAKVIILDNRLERLNSLITVLNNMPDVEVVRVFYYNTYTGVLENVNATVEKLDIWDFREVLDGLYANNVLMLFNTDLDERLEENIFEYRTQVNYAMREQRVSEDYNIWFYTLAGKKSQQEVEEIFPGHVVDATVIDGQLNLNLVDCDSLYRALTME